MITFRNIANKLFLPVNAFDPRSRLFPHYRFSGPSSQMLTDEARNPSALDEAFSWLGAVIHKRLIGYATHYLFSDKKGKCSSELLLRKSRPPLGVFEVPVTERI